MSQDLRIHLTKKRDMPKASFGDGGAIVVEFFVESDVTRKKRIDWGGGARSARVRFEDRNTLARLRKALRLSDIRDLCLFEFCGWNVS